MFAIITPGLVVGAVAERIRFSSYTLFIVLFGVLVFAFLIPHVLLGAFTHRVASGLVLGAHLFLLLLLYCLWFWVRAAGTLAMQTWHIALRTRDGQIVRPRQALLRYLLCWPSIALGGVGLVWALIDRDGLFLHDRIAGTCLLKKEVAP